MIIPKDKREELNKLSQEVYGSQSKWRKILEGKELVSSRSVNKKGEEIKVLTPKRPTLEEVETKLKAAYESLQKEKEDARKQSESKSDSTNPAAGASDDSAISTTGGGSDSQKG